MDFQSMQQNPWGYRVATDISRERTNHWQAIATRVIDLAGGILVCLLLARFVFMLLGANQTNGLATFVYSFTTPFVTPFASLFNYDHFAYGVSHFEGFTLVAMAVYALITAGLRRLATLAWW
jgi:hypothetical protein